MRRVLTWVGAVAGFGLRGAWAETSPARAEARSYGMGVDAEKCIGCGLCVEACKT